MKFLRSLISVLLLSAGAVFADGLDEERFGKPTNQIERLLTRAGFDGAAKSYALVIGVNEFDNFENLPTENDPLRVADHLIDKADFDMVHVLTGDKVTDDRVRELMLDKFRELVDPNDRFLIYWSGHGVTIGQGDGAVGFLPVKNSRPEAISSMVAMQDLHRWSNFVQPNHKLFLLDSCFSGLVGAAVQSDTLEDLSREQMAGKGSHIISAGRGSEQTIAIDELGGSIFTHALLKGLSGAADSYNQLGGDNLITVSELKAYISLEVARLRRVYGWNRQITPQLRDAIGSDGEFFFPVVAAFPDQSVIDEQKSGKVFTQSGSRGNSRVTDELELLGYSPEQIARVLTLLEDLKSNAGPFSRKIKVGFVFVGPIADEGWNFRHNVGRTAIEEHFGEFATTAFVESVPEGPDAERVLTSMAKDGADLIFATSFGYMDPTINVAEKFPDVKFEVVTAYKQTDNVATYAARTYEGRAVQGLIAGRITKTNKIGYIGSFPIPEVLRGINASFLHARKVNPKVEMEVVWAYTWFDPAKETDAANALIKNGVDVILQHTDSTAPHAVAAEAGNVATFGQVSDMTEYAPFPRVSSIVDNWAPYYVKRAQDVMDDAWTSADNWVGLGSGVVQIGEITEAVPEDVKAEALKLRDEIAEGTYHPFTGPVRLQDGTLWLEDGETASDEDLLGMNFYVEGIKGEVPQ